MMKITNIMKTQKNSSKHFIFSPKMMKIRLGILCRKPRKLCCQWRMIIFVACMRNFLVSIITIKHTMTTQSCWQDTVKHIKSLLNRMTNPFRISQSHKVSRFIFRKFFSTKSNNFLDFMDRLPHTHSSHRNTIHGKRRKCLY